MAYINGREIWFAMNGGGSGEQPQLFAPSIAKNGDILTITNNASNGAFVTVFNIFINGEVKANVAVGKTFDLSTLGLAAGTYTVTARACGTNFKASAASNALTHTVSGSPEARDVPVTYNLTGVTTDGLDIIPASMVNMEIGFNFTAKAGYTLPDEVSVTGCKYAWNKNVGMLYISDFAGNVTITVVGVKGGNTTETTISCGEYYAYGGSGDGQSDANAHWLTKLRAANVTLPCSIDFAASQVAGVGASISCSDINNSDFSGYTCYGLIFQTDGRITFELEDGETVDAWNDYSNGLDVIISLSAEDFPNGVIVSENAYNAFNALFEIR